jgi:hypothetical protein
MQYKPDVKKIYAKCDEVDEDEHIPPPPTKHRASKKKTPQSPEIGGFFEEYEFQDEDNETGEKDKELMSPTHNGNEEEADYEVKTNNNIEESNTTTSPTTHRTTPPAENLTALEDSPPSKTKWNKQRLVKKLRIQEL